MKLLETKYGLIEFRADFDEAIGQIKKLQSLLTNLDSGCLHRKIRFFIAIDEPSRQVGHALHGIDVAGHLGDLLLDQLELPDRPAELLARPRVMHDAFHQLPDSPGPSRPHREAAAVENVHGQLEALADFAEHVLNRHRSVVEIHCAS